MDINYLQHKLNWRGQHIQDPEFLAELEKLEPGYQVARLRIKLGLAQTQLGEMVGTKQPSIARLENGLRFVKFIFSGKKWPRLWALI